MSPQERISKTRLSILMTNAFLGYLVMRLKLVISSSVPTAATDGNTIIMNPKYISELRDQDLEILFAHELLHCVLQHHKRIEDRNAKIWNYAADYAVNHMLVHGFGYGRLAGMLLDDKYANMTTEAIYAKLASNADSKNQKTKGDDSGNEGKDGEEGGSSDGPAPPAKTQTPIDGQVVKAESLSGDGPPSQDWGGIVEQAVAAAKSQGANVPPELDKQMGQGKASKEWLPVLWRWFSPSRMDLSWARPDRRLISSGIYLPSRGGERLEHAAIVVDTSGSISPDELAVFSDAITAILNFAMPVQTTLVYADLEVQATHVMSEASLPIGELPKAPMGGGTDFRPAINYLESVSPKPDVAVYLTDLWGPCGNEPDFPMLWLCTTDRIAPWGTTCKTRLV